MADAWAEFRLPESNAARLTRNDQPPVTAPRDVPVQSSQKVWGDQEAQSAGLYEQAGDPWAAFRVKPEAAPKQSAPLRITVNPLPERMGQMQQPAENAPALQAGLDARAAQMTQGPAVPPATSMAVDFNNLVPAASQGTSPHVADYKGKLISDKVFEGDDGSIYYQDPSTGKISQTNQGKQVAIRDPADNTVKIYERSPDTNESSATGVARVLAPGLAAGAPTARAAISSAENVVPKASDIFSTAKPYYRAFENEAGKVEVPAQSATEMGDRIRSRLEKVNFIPELAPPVYSAIKILDKGEPITLDALQNVKRVIGRSFNSPDKNIRDAASVASAEIGKIISETSVTAGQNLKTADQIHSTARSVQDLQRKQDIAGLRAGRAGYGGNSVNSMRQLLSPIVQKSIEGKVTGFKPDEIQAMRDIVEGTTATNTLRQVGAMSPSKGVMQIALGGATGGATAAVGAGANKLATVLTSKQIDRLRELTAKRSPAYAEAVDKAVTRFQQSQIDFVNNPGPNKLAAYISASRALSAGLTRDGIKVTSGDLLRQLTGSNPVSAEDQQGN